MHTSAFSMQQQQARSTREGIPGPQSSVVGCACDAAAGTTGIVSRTDSGQAGERLAPTGNIRRTRGGAALRRSSRRLARWGGETRGHWAGLGGYPTGSTNGRWRPWGFQLESRVVGVVDEDVTDGWVEGWMSERYFGSERHSPVVAQAKEQERARHVCSACLPVLSSLPPNPVRQVIPALLCLFLSPPICCSRPGKLPSFRGAPGRQEEKS